MSGAVNAQLGISLMTLELRRLCLRQRLPCHALPENGRECDVFGGMGEDESGSVRADLITHNASHTPLLEGLMAWPTLCLAAVCMALD
jgi:hypothetical protein